ncbi:LysR family transcriptional regulator [Catenulispora sp. NL8]|uniref:LysR family transcriptional regulator n=1 Tax=Catenulispora pinistramenti TaxID=2705254 RepID=A0ABS5KTD2_9ACTN|nr:LysR family transcriptional regulator [Catenulispora pinistramenti]MBS2549297.1 LysR family transcriptional regulator [Catenulispora pinistramenti]
MELDPKRLLTLALIAEHGGIAPAARALGTTPSAVSQQLSRLEQDLGLPLVDRGASSVRLTVAGRLLAGFGERVERALADAAHELVAYTEQAAGPVSIGLPLAAVPEVAATALPWLAEHHPGIEPRLVEAYTDDGLPALRVGDLDILLVADDRETAIPVPPGLHSFVVFEGLYRIVVPASWPTPTSPADLDGRPWVGAPAGSARVRAFGRFAAKHGITPSVEHLAVHQMTTRAMVSAQLGAALLPEYIAATTPGATLCDLEVAGTYLVRMFRRRLTDRSVPAVEAAASAFYDAMLVGAERYSDSPQAPRPVHIVHPQDPSQTASSRPRPPVRGGSTNPD